MSIVRLRATVALLGRFPALAGVDLDVGPREVVLVQGPNGAGKSTLLRLCAGLLRPESGDAEVLGHDLSTDRAAVRRRVGLLGHDTALYDDLTVDENLEFWARALPAVDRAAVRPALDRLGVAARLRGVQIGLLSAGQRRRVALAGVVVRRPELWLLDEPHAGLDQDGRALVDDLVVDAAAGATVLVASHELDRTQGLATRRLTVAGGMITADEQLVGGADAG